MKSIICPKCACSLDTDAKFGELVQCPHCTRSFNYMPAAEVGALEPIAAREYLESIRSKSNYGSVRAIINLVTLVGLLAIIVGTFLRISSAEREVILPTLSVSVMAIVMVLAFHQVCSVLFDVADALIDIGRKSR